MMTAISSSPSLRRRSRSRRELPSSSLPLSSMAISWTILLLFLVSSPVAATHMANIMTTGMTARSLADTAKTNLAAAVKKTTKLFAPRTSTSFSSSSSSLRHPPLARNGGASSRSILKWRGAALSSLLSRGDDEDDGDGRSKARRAGESRRAAIAAAVAASCLSVRGGGAFSDDDESDYDFDDEFDDSDDLYDFDDFDDMEMAEDDFGTDGTVERTVAAWKKTPPFTKAYLSASMAVTAWGYVANKNEFPKMFLLEWKPILTKLQLWRPITAFLNFGPFGLGYAMTGHFVWTYMSTLERLNHDRPYDFWLMILFGCSSMVAGYTFLNISPRFLGHNLSTFLVYVWSRYHEGLEVNMFELFNTRAEMLPWFFLAQTFLLEGEIPILDLLGILFGHIYHHCKTTNLIRTPTFVVDWYDGDSDSARSIREKYKSVSSDFEMQ